MNTILSFNERFYDGLCCWGWSSAPYEGYLKLLYPLCPIIRIPDKGLDDHPPYRDWAQTLTFMWWACVPRGAERGEVTWSHGNSTNCFSTSAGLWNSFRGWYFWEKGLHPHQWCSVLWFRTNMGKGMPFTFWHSTSHGSDRIFWS